jgi:nicotinate dehydrogenase subunit A
MSAGSMMEVEATLSINGEEVRVPLERGETLLEALRRFPRLRGTHFGCGQENCGACVVLVDGAATYSCTFLAEDAVKRAVLTVEGLGGPAAPHAIQRAFLLEQAGQCGYCLPGIMMSAKALLDGNPHPTRAEIVAALDRHLCRCGTHHRIVRAIERAARDLVGDGS